MFIKLHPNHFQNMYKIMEESFPIDEYRPYEDQKNLLKNDNYCIYALQDNDNQNIKAFITLWRFDDFAFIEHFAVDAKYRGGGIGSSLLQEVIKSLKCRVCLEVEPPIDALCKKRIKFYKKNGFHLNDYSYIQPPVSKGRKELQLLIMTSHSKVLKNDFENLKRVLYKHVYNIELK